MARRRIRKNGGTPHVALIVETSLASGRGVLLGVARFVREHAPWSIYYEPRSLVDRVPRWLRNWRGDGIIARIQNRQIAKAVMETGLPVVDVLGMVPDLPVPLVHADNQAIACEAAQHLIERGFTYFGYCGVGRANWSLERQQAFLRTGSIMGRACSVIQLPQQSQSENSWEAQQDRLARWIAQLPKPAGVMACNDPRGQLVLDACRRAGVKVPDQVGVIGVDDDRPICEVSSPPLSSVDPNAEAIGFHAAELLAKLMAGKTRRRKPKLIQPKRVVVRESTDVMAINDRDVSKALAFIREHACRPIKVDDVVRRVPVSRTVLNERFRSLLGRGVHAEIVRVRVGQAKELIRHSDLPLKEIARRCAFRHPEYMGVVFRRVLGVSPGQVRRQES